VILDGAVIGRGSVIGGGAVIPPGTVVPPHSLVMGVPGKVVRDLGPGSGESNRAFADSYVGYAATYLGQGE
jgi:carbonic anhydrase/acetyltransferase-like protein (isoleucine patch superfamily)